MNDQQLKASVGRMGWGITDDEIDAAFAVAKSMTGELGSIDDREPVAVMILHKKNTGEGAAAESWLNEIIAAPQRYRAGHGGAEVPGDIVRSAAATAEAVSPGAASTDHWIGCSFFSSTFCTTPSSKRT